MVIPPDHPGSMSVHGPPPLPPPAETGLFLPAKPPGYPPIPEASTFSPAAALHRQKGWSIFST